jgi:hypothetical protein
MPVVTIDDVRRLALSLPRTEEKLIGDRVKFRVGRLVYASISPDETLMGFGFPKEERAALVPLNRLSSSCPFPPTSVTTGSGSGWPQSTWPR